jgi:hypothetical protein
MLNEMYDMETEPNKPEILIYIPEGLAVIDVNGKRVGTVRYFQAPSTSAYPDLSDFPPELRSSSMPDELVLRFLSTGFICVNAGFLARDRFVFLYQVDHVTDSAVYLETSADNLLKA